MSPITGMYREQLVESLGETFRRLCTSVSQVSQREFWQAGSAWRRAFTPDAAKTRSLGSADMWAPLAFDEAGSQRGAAAVGAYVRRTERKFFVMLEYEELGFRCGDGLLPSYELLQDLIARWRLSSVFVVETSYDWTFVVTSEQADYGGPFYATSAVAEPSTPE